VASETSQASTEFRSTGLISTTRMRPSTVYRPGLVSEPIGVTAGSPPPSRGEPRPSPSRGFSRPRTGDSRTGLASEAWSAATAASSDLIC
jgi:hypothetical protein